MSVSTIGPIREIRKGVWQTAAVDRINFWLPLANRLILDGRIVIAALLPNTGKALAAQGLTPQIAVVHERQHLNEIFFPCDVGSVQNGYPLIIVVPSQEMKELVERYMMEAYRPLAKSGDPYACFQLDEAKVKSVNIPRQEQADLIMEVEFYDPRCERNLSEIIKIVVVESGASTEVRLKESRIAIVNRGDGNYRFNGQELNMKAVNDVEIDKAAVPFLDQWRPNFGLFMLGVNTGGMPTGLSTSILLRTETKDNDLVVDCGPQIPQILKQAQLDLNRISWILTHSHPDHDAGLFDLLKDETVKQIPLYANPFAARSFVAKAELLGLAEAARAKVFFLGGQDFDLGRFEKSRFNLIPSAGVKRIGQFEVEAEWTLHGIPTTMLKIADSTGRAAVLTADGAFSSDRLAEITWAGALSPQRKARLEGFLRSGINNAVLIEEIGRGLNHSTRPMELLTQPIERRYVHWSLHDDLPANNVARTFEIVNL